MSLGFAVDASYSEGDAEIFEYLKDQGVELFIQCLWTSQEQPPPRVMNLITAQEAGLPVAGYISLNSRATGVFHVGRGAKDVPRELWDDLKFIAIDVELPRIRIEQVKDAVEWLIALGKQPVIYTSWNAWTNLTVPSNSDVLSSMDIPLWNAYWDSAPDIDFPSLRYGGWEDHQVWLEQWSGGVDMELFVDRNTFVREEVFRDMEYLTKAEAKAAGMFLEAAAKVLAQKELTDEERENLIWLLTQ